jgi:two-component system sensor histidine kinase KdpD
MSELRHNHPPRLDLASAASFLSVSADTISSLVAAGFLTAVLGQDGPEFAQNDLRAFLARNADNGSGNLMLDEPDGVDPQVLLDALDGRSEEMARRAFDIFASAFPEAHSWSLREQARFIDQAKNRFEAILAVTSQGSAVDESLVGDLQDVGAAAAWGGSPLPQLLVILRISRDLVVQTAVGVAEEGGQHWGLALSLLLTRVLPAMDRLTDALAQGYWAALAGREEELRDRYEHVVETSSNGVYEVDLDGRMQYANPSLGIILGRPLDQLDGALIGDVFVPIGGSDDVSALMTEPPGGVTGRCELMVARSDGVRRLLEIHTTTRYRFEELVGYQGVVRDMTTAHDLEADKNEFVALVTSDLRSPLANLMGQGANLEANAHELGVEQVSRIGASIRGQVERISRLADDLLAVSQLNASQMVVNSRPVDLAQVVHAAVPSVRRPGGVDVRIPLGVEVLADPRRLEQVVANVVDNGLEHGREPVVVELIGADAGLVELTIVDHGEGVPADRVDDLFAGLRTVAGPDRVGSRGTGLGLGLVKGLMEAMGGRVTYEPAEGGGACFRLVLPVPSRLARPDVKL